jgi:hypothetical protein
MVWIFPSSAVYFATKNGYFGSSCEYSVQFYFLIRRICYRRWWRGIFGGTSIFVRGLCFGVAALYLTTTKIKMVVIIMPHTTQPGIDTESLGVGGLLFPLFV